VSAFSPLQETTIHVARRTGFDADGQPQYGTVQQVTVRHETIRPVDRETEGDSVDTADKLTTDNYEFEPDDAIWLPGDDETKTAEARTPQDTSTATIAHITLSQAIL